MIDDDQPRALREAAAVEPQGDGCFDANLSLFYTVIGGHPNGGYIQTVVANAAVAAASQEGSSHLHATAVSTNFVGATNVGPAQLTTEVRRVGRGVSFVHVTLRQEGVLAVESLVTLGSLHVDSLVRYADAAPPPVAPLISCRRSTGGDEVNLMNAIDLRLDPSCADWATGARSQVGEMTGWLRLDDGGALWDPWSLLLASDAMPPATFPLASSGWVPTLQLTSYVRQVPVGEWLRARQWCVVIADGLVDERCELFDERNQLVASASQLAMVRFPGGV